MAVYSLRVQSDLPVQSQYFPIVSYYFLFSMLYALFSLIWFLTAVYLENIYLTKNDMPKYLEKLIFILNKIWFYRIISYVGAEKKDDKDKKDMDVEEMNPYKCLKCQDLEKCVKCIAEKDKEDKKKKKKEKSELDVRYLNKFMFSIIFFMYFITNLIIWTIIGSSN